MKFTMRRCMLLLPLALALGSVTASAQMDRVVAEAHNGDIDCLPCAVTIELNLKRVPGVDKVAVSMSKQLVAITFKDGARFLPKQYRDAIWKAEVRIDRFHAALRGKAERDGDQVFFNTGVDRFPIAAPPEDLAMGVPLGIMATMDDKTSPATITSIEDAKPLD